MGQVSKMLGTFTDAPVRTETKALEPMSISAAASTSNIVDTSIAKASVPAKTPKVQCNLNPKAAAFQPSQSFPREEVDMFMTSLQLNLDPQAPAYVMPSQALISQKSDATFSKLASPEASFIPCQLPLGFQEPPGLERWSNASTTLDSLPRWSTPSTSLDSLPSPRQFMGKHSQPGKMRFDTKSTQNSKGKNAPNPDRKKDETMKAQLEALKLEDPECVFIVRGINKLGFSSPKILRAFFSRYGEVKEIYVSPSRVKSMYRYGDQRSTEAHWRLRAAPLGFVVMKYPKATASILADGPEQDVNGVTVRFQPFHRHIEDGNEDEQ
mmetsp:Transcript_9470/g.16284  ORF Transcript_9470/g.16284 Transcript_9470/m.16284 type:complete len:324 (-) Transcript_9470:355-1326(-)